MSHLLTREVAKTAVSEVRQLFNNLVVMDTFDDRKDLHVVVLDPTQIWREGRGIGDEGVVLYDDMYGMPSAKYKYVALSKAEISWRTGLPSRIVRENAPYLLNTGDTIWGGSWVYEGLVVAASGVQEHWDETISAVIVMMCRAYAIGGTKDELARAMDIGTPFLGNDQYKNC